MVSSAVAYAVVFVVGLPRLRHIHAHFARDDTYPLLVCTFVRIVDTSPSSPHLQMLDVGLCGVLVVDGLPWMGHIHAHFVHVDTYPLHACTIAHIADMEPENEKIIILSICVDHVLL